MAARTRRVALNFKAMRQAEVPQGRNGKHKAIVNKILSDLDQLPPGRVRKANTDQFQRLDFAQVVKNRSRDEKVDVKARIVRAQRHC